jgi:hypothetical protein
VDFPEAVSQHQAWKQRLRRILLGRERRRRPERTEATEPDRCPLEGWLLAHQGRLGGDPLFRYAEEQHRRSHELAIQMVLNDERTRASMDMVYQIGQFQICSRNLLETLEQLRRKHALSEAPLCPLPPGFPRDEFPPVPGAPG